MFFNENDENKYIEQCLLSSVGMQVQFPVSVSVSISHSFPSGPLGELLCFVTPAPEHLQSDKEIGKDVETLKTRHYINNYDHSLCECIT